MENEEKNINDNLEEIQEEQFGSMFDETIEETQEEADKEDIDETLSIDEIKEENSIVEQIQEEKVEEIEQASLEEEKPFILDGTEEEQIEVVEQKTTESIENKELVSFADDFEAEEKSDELITVRPIKFQQFEQTSPNRSIKKNLDIMQDISMHISVELGRTKSSIREVMEMEQGTVVELDKIAGEQVEIFVNDKLVAKGEVIVIEDRFGVRITSTNIQKQAQ